MRLDMTISQNLKQLPPSERPRERLLNLGPQALAVTELIAVILGNGTKGKSVLVLAQELLTRFGTLRQLGEASIEDLCSVKGLGPAKAVQLKAALGLALRIHREESPPKQCLGNPERVFHWVKHLIAYEKKEVFGVILLDARGSVLRWEPVSIGTLTQTLVHPREVFYLAIRHLAASLILAHNHPSGDPAPSAHDLHLTRVLIQAAQSIGIPIQDHLIVTPQRYFSFKEKGLVFEVRTPE